MFGAPIDEMALKEKPKFLKRFLQVLEYQLEKHTYVVRETISIADISLLSAIDGLETIDVDMTPFPQLEAWRERIRSQDFYKQIR
jgi:glutathione S-transferase